MDGCLNISYFGGSNNIFADCNYLTLYSKAEETSLEDKYPDQDPPPEYDSLKVGKNIDNLID